MTTLGGLKEDLETYNNLLDNLKISRDLITLGENINTGELNNYFKEVDKLELKSYLNKEFDKENCLLEIHSGAGGTEANDWVNMLKRMYERFISSLGYKAELIDFLEGDEAGFKSVSLKVTGPFAYGYLKEENGVHRLVRNSPFDSNKRRHTSFASVKVTPLVSKDNEIIIEDKDIRIDIYRSSGKGGQGVNTTDSAVRITHFPTGLVATCQNERSQIQNKEEAMKILKNKIYLRNKEIEDAKKNKDYENSSDINFGSQIRSYVLSPYELVKDHRYNFEKTDVNKVLDGDIMDFIEESLKHGKKS